ncbi:GPI-anchor transamidase subunit GPI16 [Spizellomyces punctatus DAOM BR117]|uniref:Gpi16 subunit, GPI transamidase component n=1 Tax=Spizellomyces punctatus (strain DAOM BR117) TaxID=645134 RepID=A0A0L0HJH9_SPIPD|nr:GPI-anchor transamidase subunit GPI16 [Spizellomyces punctatus DAOM BR117]KND00994.1 hypothetical protein SPPG_04090 [Spizellomyces punctatus DAOM BR117]|eukprot:XP_016609033.1 hypothetical protein SPPG_04090 [Spizellomyces punctatus DAOM BR117]
MAWTNLVLTTILGLLLALHAAAAPEESYDEKLKLTQFKDGKVLAEFYFTRFISPSAVKKAKDNHYTLLPRSIGEIIQSFGVKELHLTFTQGTWNHEKWGYSPLSAPGGVQLWSWFETANVDSQWKGLTHALAGLFCASLNFIDQSATAEPLLSFRTNGTVTSASELTESNSPQLRYGSLPREAVCTENLTPWVKLLPCQTKAGIASLFNAYRLFDGNFHSMGTHLRPICTDAMCEQRGIEFVQTLAVVLDPMRLDNRKDWSLQTIFERKLDSACPVAENTQIVVTVPETSGFTFRPSPPDVKQDGKGHTIATYPIHRETPKNMDVGITWSNPTVNHTIDRTHSYIRANRYLTGYGGERGGLSVDLYNYRSSAIPVTYFESIPWILKLYLHTLKVETSVNKSTAVVGDIFFQPAIDRGRPSVLEMQLTLPPNSTTTISIEFDKAFVKYTEHPPDANRGFDIGAAVISLRADEGEQNTRIYTETLLISLPTPDFSMPYNVITLTCTLIALFFGSMFNLLTRRFEPLTIKR